MIKSSSKHLAQSPTGGKKPNLRVIIGFIIKDLVSIIVIHKL